MTTPHENLRMFDDFAAATNKASAIHNQARKWKARALAAEQARDAAEQSAIDVHTASLTLVAHMAKPPAAQLVNYRPHVSAATISGKVIADGIHAVLEPGDLTVNVPHQCEIATQLRAERDKAVDDLGTLRHDLKTLERLMGENDTSANRTADELRRERNALSAVLDSFGVKTVGILSGGDLAARMTDGREFHFRKPDAAASVLSSSADRIVTIHFGHANTPTYRAAVEGRESFHPSAVAQAVAAQLNDGERPALRVGGRAAGKTVEGLLLERDATAAKLTATEADRDRVQRSLDATAHAHSVMVAERDALQVERDAASTRVRELEAETDHLRETITAQKTETTQLLASSDEHARKLAAELRATGLQAEQLAAYRVKVDECMNDLQAEREARLKDADLHAQTVTQIDELETNLTAVRSDLTRALETKNSLIMQLDGLLATNYDNAETAVAAKRRADDLAELLEAARNDLRISAELNAGLVAQLDVKAGSERALVNALDAIRVLQYQIEPQDHRPTFGPRDL